MKHLEDPKVRTVEVDVDTLSYEEGHVPGAISWDWSKQLCDTHQRDILSKAAFEQLMSKSGVEEDTTVILYVDNNNWLAACPFWQISIYGHKNVRLLNGGR